MNDASKPKMQSRNPKILHPTPGALNFCKSPRAPRKRSEVEAGPASGGMRFKGLGPCGVSPKDETVKKAGLIQGP